MLAVTRETQGRGDDELRRTARPRALDGGANDFQALREVGPVDRAALVTVGLGPIDQVRTGELAVVRRGIRVVIVGGHDDQRDVLDRGDVHAFVRRTGLHAAFANRGKPDKPFSPFIRLAINLPTTTETIAPRW